MSETSRPSVGIHVKAVSVAGFRALRDVCVELDPATTVLIGENNTGKSAFLEALDVVMGIRQAVPDDLHVTPEGTQRHEFLVDVLLVPAVGNRFSALVRPLLADAIRRGDTGQDSREYVAIRTVASLGEDRSAINRRRCFLDGWPGLDIPADGEPTEIQGSLVRNPLHTLISFTLLQADRDLVAEMRRRTSRWGRLLAQRDLAHEQEDEVEQRLGELAQLVLDHSPVLGRLRDRLAEVHETMPTVEQVELEPLPSRLDDLTRATDVLVTAPNGPRLPLRMQGLGSRSLAELMVYRAFAAELSGRDEPYEPHGLACFEEPEAHLHPQAQLALMTVIDQMTGQRIVTTHSPQIAAEAEIRTVRLFRSSDAGITVSQVSSVSEEELIKLRRLAERPHGQVLFSRLVIIGDGATERAALPVFARAHWGMDPEAKGVTFVDPLSLGQAPVLIGLLDDLGIPWLVLADGDRAARTALKRVASRLRRSSTYVMERVVALPDRQDFERYLVGQGLESAIRQGVADLYGEDALSEFGRRSQEGLLDGDELLIRFLSKNKGTYGAAVAEAILSVESPAGRPAIPEAIDELLRRADRILGNSRP